MLIVDLPQRLTAKETLGLPFFEQVHDTHRQKVKSFDAERKFKVAIQVVRASVRMQLQMQKRKSCRDILGNPYAVEFLRQFIDASAFQIYGHWAKTTTDRNRVAFFENTSRTNQQTMLKIKEKFSILTPANGEILNSLSSERNLVFSAVH